MASQVVRAHARRVGQVDRMILSCFVLDISTRKIAHALIPVLGEPGEAEIAKTELEDLVDKFAAEFGDYVEAQQREAAKRDPEYFLRLIDLARVTLIKE